MSKLSGWKIVCLAVAGVALSPLAADVVGADSFSDQAAKLDIIGVHLGMTPAQAKSVVVQHHKGMSWKEGRNALGIPEDPILDGADARWGGVNLDRAGEIVDVVFSPPPGDPKVLALSRVVVFEKSQAPTVETLFSSLTDKFGQPTYQSQVGAGDHEMVWTWDKAGQISKPSVQLDACSGEWLSNNLDRMGANSFYFIPDLQRESDGGCAMGVRAIIRVHSSSPGIADGLDMTLIDPHDALPAAIATADHLKQVKQAKADEALKKASANKPSL
ncbi:MAG: hypothetical protein WA993_09540 [Candidatus Binatus sp.]